MNDNNDYSPVIQELATQRQTGTAPGLPSQAQQRQCDLDRISATVNEQPLTAESLAAMTPDERDNAEKTHRWAMEDLASKAKYAQSTAERKGFIDALDAKHRDYVALFGNRTMAFADGGKVADADALMAQMRAKYGLGPSAASTPAPQPPQPAPPASASPKPAGSLVEQTGNLIRGRAAQIDKASGYQRGGKIKGPGTATSDSIPAKVKQTGEDILVSNGERILSAKQDQLLHRIAMERGFESVDAMLEHGTGEPVGPTIKAGKKAAASGLSPEEEFGQANGSNLAPLNGQTTKQGSYPSKLEQALTGAPVVPAATTLERNADLGPSVVSKAIQADFADRRGAPPLLGNEGRSVPSAIPLAGGHPVSVPASRAAVPALSPIVAPQVSRLTTQDVVPNGFTDRGAGIVGSRSANGQLNVMNVGTENFSNRNSPIVDGSASALIDQKNSTYNPQRQLENMQRSRLTGYLTTGENIDPAVQQQAREGLKAMDAATATGAKADLETAQAGQAKAITAQAQQVEEMRAKLLDPNTPADERTQLLQTLQAIGGHGQRTAPYQVHDTEEPIDASKPFLGNVKTPRLFDPNRGTLTAFDQGQSQGGDALSQAKTAIARGANKAAVNARLKALGLPEIK